MQRRSFSHSPAHHLLLQITQASLLLSTSAAMAATNCSTSGNVVTTQCSTTDIQMVGGTGTSSLTVTDTTANSSVAVLSSPYDSGPFTQNLTIDGTTVLNRSDYPAVYMYSSQPGWDANLQIGSGVSITSEGPFGAVWLRSESNDTSTSNTIVVDSAASISSSGASSDGITATSNNGAVSLTNRGSVTVVVGRGLYADGGSASLTRSVSASPTWAQLMLIRPAQARSSLTAQR